MAMDAHGCIHKCNMAARVWQLRFLPVSRTEYPKSYTGGQGNAWRTHPADTPRSEPGLSSSTAQSHRGHAASISEANGSTYEGNDTLIAKAGEGYPSGRNLLWQGSLFLWRNIISLRKCLQEKNNNKKKQGWRFRKTLTREWLVVRVKPGDSGPPSFRWTSSGV